MKNLVLITLIGIVIAGCCAYPKMILPSDATLRSRLKDSDAMNYKITLNGVDSTDAAKMKSDYLTYRGQDSRPERETFWFSRTAILHMYNLLTAEQAQEKAYGIDSGQRGFTDGIRIYFVSDMTQSKCHIANSIILVSTKNAGPDDSVPSGAHHKDYYTHSKKDILFSNLDSISAQWSPHDILKNWGQNLYNGCLNCNVIASCDTDKPHYITQLRAHKMVKQFETKGPLTTTSEWFDYNLIKDLATDAVHDGIRIYIARHPKTLMNGHADTDAMKEAFIWVTTKPDRLNKTAHDDYYDCTTTEHYFLNFAAKMKRKGRNPYDGDGGSGGTSGGQDNGEICPTHCE